MTKDELIALINSDVNTNGAEAITGAILNNVLQEMVNFSQDEPYVFFNDSGANINIGDVVQLTGYSIAQTAPTVEKVNGSLNNSQLFIAAENVLNGASGSFIRTAYLTGLSGLGAFADGDKVYWDVATGAYSTYTVDSIFIGIRLTASSMFVHVNENISVKGSGTSGRVARWSTSSLLNDSIIQDDGTTIGIGGAPIVDALIRLLATDKEALRGSVSSANPLISLIALRMLSSAGGGAESTGIEGEAIGGLINIGVEGNAYGAGDVENIGVKGTATQGSATGENIGGHFVASGGLTNYVLHLQDGTEGINKILLSVTADGKCNFSNIKTVNGSSLLGSGNISTTQTLAQTLALGNSTNGENIVFDGGDATVTFQEASVDFPYINIIPFAAFPEVIQFQGLKYDADYSANFTTNSLVTKKYVDDNSASSGRFGIADSNGVYTYYTTLTLAMAAATSGQTIDQFTDYIETGAVTITLKDGVNINGNGHTYTSSSNSNHFIFKDNNVAVNCAIQNLTVRKTGTVASDVLNYSLYIQNASSKVDCTGSRFYSTSQTAAISGYLNGGYYEGINVSFGNYCCVSVVGTLTNASLKGLLSGVSPESSACLFNSGKVDSITIETINVRGLLNSGGYATNVDVVSVSSVNNTSYSGIHNLTGNLQNCTVKANQYGIYNQGGYTQNCSSYSSANTAIYGDSGYISNCSGISSSQYGIRTVGTCKLSNSFGYSSSNIGIVGPAENCKGESASSHGISGYDSETYTNCTVISSTNVAAANGLLWSNCHIESKWNNVGGHALQQGYANMSVVNCTFKVANAGAYCIDMFNGVTSVKYANNTFIGATTPLDPTIVQAITNTFDNQGNILI